MKRAILLSICAILCYFSAATVLAAAPTPETIVKDMLKKIRSVNSFEEVAVQSIEARSQGRSQKTEVSSRFAYKKPNKFLYSINDPRAGMDCVSDGKTIWAHVTAAKQYVKRKAPDSITGADLLTTTMDPPAFLRGENPLEGASNLKLVGKESKDGKSTYHISYTNAQRGTVHMWIGADDSLLYRVQVLQPIPNGELLLMETHTKMKVNGNIPDSTFTFTPPKDAKEVDLLPGERGAARA